MRPDQLKQNISKWWNGRMYGSEPGEDGPFIMFFVYHPTALWARRIVGFLKREYKFVIGTLLTVIGLVITASAF